MSSIARPGWLTKVSSGQASALRTALAGLYKFAGVHWIREQIEASFEQPCPPFSIAPEGLVVWPDGKFRAEALYDLTGNKPAYPRISGDIPATDLPALDPNQVVYKRAPLTWEAWVETWEKDQSGKGSTGNIVEEFHFFPPACRCSAQDEKTQ
jgi:hypothetical protein